MPFWGGVLGRIKNWFIGFPEGAAKSEFDVTPAISREMMTEINLWYSLYVGQAPWVTRDVVSLNIPASICRELARPTLSELEVTIEGAAGEYLMEQFAAAQKRFQSALETFLALGGGAFKPYIFNDRILVSYCSPNTFQPTRFDVSGDCVGGVFKECIKSHGQYYVKLESHEFENGRYVIRNKAFESAQIGSIGRPVGLDTVPEWAALQEEQYIDNIEHPLFAYFRTPRANKTNPDSGVGVSMYADAIELIRQADVQWERLQWEYKSGERKIFGEGSAVNVERFGRDRLYAFGPFWSDNGDLLHEFSPEYRDSSLYSGFQNILKQIEFNVGLSFGTISDPMSVERTATEIQATKQRMYTTIEGIKRNLESSLDGLIYAVSVMAGLYGLAPAGEYTVTYKWGDSILEDTTAKQLAIADMRNDVSAGLIRPELYIMRKYNVTEEEAVAMMPSMDSMVQEEQDEVE